MNTQVIHAFASALGCLRGALREGVEMILREVTKYIPDFSRLHILLEYLWKGLVSMHAAVRALKVKKLYDRKRGIFSAYCLRPSNVHDHVHLGEQLGGFQLVGSWCRSWDGGQDNKKTYDQTMSHTYRRPPGAPRNVEARQQIGSTSDRYGFAGQKPNGHTRHVASNGSDVT